MYATPLDIVPFPQMPFLEYVRHCGNHGRTTVGKSLINKYICIAF